MGAGNVFKSGKNISKTAEKITLNAKDGDITLNAAKSVKYSADKDIIYDSFQSSKKDEGGKLKVVQVTGPKEVEIGKTYNFKANLFSEAIKDPKVLEDVKWAYQLDNEGIKDFPNPKGTVIGKSVVKKVAVNDDVWDNKKATVYAYFEDKEGEGKLETKVKFDPIELLLIFYIDEDHTGNTMMAEAAQTRLKNIKNSDWYDSSIHKVHCPPIQSIDEIIEIVPRYYKKYGGKGKVVMKEMGVVSHSGDDGPISYETDIKVCPHDATWPHQMAMCGWEKIDLLWSEEDPICVFYGCNSGWAANGFAKRISKLSNFKNVEVWGQSTSSFPSFYPDRRITTLARNMGTGWEVGETYMVGGNKGEGWDSTSNIPFTEDFPKANPMNCFKNGTKIRSTHQGYFNDHRK